MATQVEILISTNDHYNYFFILHHVTKKKNPSPCKQPEKNS